MSRHCAATPGNRHLLALATVTAGLLVAAGPLSAAPSSSRPLASSLLQRAEANESVRSWYWEGGSSYFEPPPELDEPRYILRYEAPQYEVDRPVAIPIPKAPGAQAKQPNGQKPVSSQKPAPAVKKVNRITCEAATQIVAGYAFSNVKPVACSGAVYAFQATRNDKLFSITLSAKDGELIKVKKNVLTASR